MVNCEAPGQKNKSKCSTASQNSITTLTQKPKPTTASPNTETTTFTSQSTKANDTSTTNTKGTPNQPKQLSNKAGVTVGIVAAVVIILAVVVLLVFLLRRQKCMKGRFAQGKKQRIINNDYVGNQSIALSDNTNGNLSNQDGHDNYHEITTDCISPNETSTYYEIDDVINSTIHSKNDNKKDGPIDKNNYFALDPQETGFNRFPTKTPDIDNEIFSNENDPKVAGVHQNETLTQLSQYTVLDPNETGFNRTNKTNPSTVYELAQSSTSAASALETSQTEKDTYNIATTNSYDVTNLSAQKELNENVYNHMCDSDYDKLKHIRRDTDVTNNEYDHFRDDNT